MDKPKDLGHYLRRIWSAFSQLCNVVFLLGHPNESISGRSHREGWAAKKWIDRLFFWQEAHCKGAYLNDLKWARQYVENRDVGVAKATINLELQTSEAHMR